MKLALSILTVLLLVVMAFSDDGANAEPWPGLLSGGPNANRQDPVLKTLPDLPPAKIYSHDPGSYSSNEIAINWQAMLAFLLAAQVQQ